MRMTKRKILFNHFYQFICLASESLSTRSSIEIPTTSHNTETKDMDHSDHNRITHPTSKISLFQQFSLLPPQHPLRFVGLCTQVFVYYLVYAYLQVSSIKFEFINIFIILY
jgi:hypothetical protein